ncbi:MAG: CHASE2 domain-containing protein [Candidatus Latescibacteria bacterium]|nr:CHASE2 domain-containing protein [Candidatus Latescibacterota bacterium]
MRALDVGVALFFRSIMNSDKTRIQLAIGPLIGILVLLYAFTDLYEHAELVSFDWRFRLRNELFGPPPISPLLGTVDIDNKTLAEEGRYQDWTRDQFADMIRVLSRYGARLIWFDIYMVEPSVRTIDAALLEDRPDLDRADFDALIAQVDFDEKLRQELVRAGNVYLSQTVEVGYGEVPDPANLDVTSRTPDQEDALQTILAQTPRLMVDPKESTLRRGRNFEPPLKILRDAARGFGYAQTIPDVDGTRRRYPLVFQYEEQLFPSIGLLLICDLLEVPVDQVQVWPGEQVHLPGARFPTGETEDVDIPIDSYGNMHVDWVGKWEDTFVHYPHISLVWVERQEILDTLKRKMAADPGLRTPRAIMAALRKEGFDDSDKVKEALLNWSWTRGIEKAVRADGSLEGATFWRAKGKDNPQPKQVALFDQVRRNNLVADLLVRRPGIDLQELAAALPEYGAEEVIESAAFVQSVLVEGRIPAGARPLYYYPFVMYEGKPLRPDDIRGKVLPYGLTGTGTQDLNVTPFQGDYPMVGLYVNVLNTVLQKRYIQRLPLWANAILLLALGTSLSLWAGRLKVITGLLQNAVSMH